VSEEVKDNISEEELAEMYDEMYKLPAWKHFCEGVMRLAERCQTVNDLKAEVLNDPIKLAVEVKSRRAKYDAYMGLLNRAKASIKRIEKVKEKIDKKRKEEVPNA